jgi:hypothetical protein
MTMTMVVMMMMMTITMTQTAAENPYRLPINTRFYEVTITKIETEAAQP